VSRVLVTGGAGLIGAAVVRRLLRDPDFEVRISDRRPAPDWMREGCEMHTGDLRDVVQARLALRGCSHVIHLGAVAGGPYSVVEVRHAVYTALFRAAIEADLERFVHVSSALVYERAERFPTTEAALADCPPPRSAAGWSALAGERYCRAAADEHGLRFTICRPCDAYGPQGPAGDDPDAAPEVAELLQGALERLRPLPVAGAPDRTRTPTHVDDIADGIVTAMAHPGGVNEDFNTSAPDELTVAEIARICWEAVGNDPTDLELEPVESAGEDVQRRWPSVDKAEQLLGWRAQIGAREGIARTAARLREQEGVTPA
jgi:UDP-glucose 4-epimerase